MNTGIRIDRLEACYAANVDVPPENFSMRCWGNKTRCGTTHCLVGNYIVKNPGCGLGLFWDAHGFAIIVEENSMKPSSWTDDRLDDHFGIHAGEITYLFYARRLLQKDALARLRNFIDSHKPTVPSLDFHHEHRVVDQPNESTQSRLHPSAA